MRMPNWVEDSRTDPDEYKRALLTYHLKRAAQFHNKAASVMQLSRACGHHSSALHNAILRGQCSLKMALAVEALVGRDIVTREQLAPEHFQGDEL